MAKKIRKCVCKSTYLSLIHISYIKQNHAELWDELKRLSEETNRVTDSFRYGKSFGEVDAEVDAYIKKNRKKPDMR